MAGDCRSRLASGGQRFGSQGFFLQPPVLADLREDMKVLDAALPFGGFKQSGCGREIGHAVLKNHIETKSVVVQL